MAEKQTGKWVTVPDEKIQHFWVNDDCDDDCEGKDEEVVVSPDWYADNGTPQCPLCGRDASYVRTEVLITPDTME